MKTQVAQRVIILGLEGPAREQLVNALSDYGVMPLWVGKPSQTNPEQMAEYNPNKVIVSLEPTIEMDLEPYSDLLSRTTVTVLYDDAEITRSLSGWDLNRWARHLAAKLLGKELLPARAKTSEAKEDDAGLDFSIDWEPGPEVQPRVEPVEVAVVAPEIAETHVAWQDTGHYDALEINSDELNAELEKLNASLSRGAAMSEASDSLQLTSFTEPLSDEPMNYDEAKLPEYSLEFVTDYGRTEELPSAEDAASTHSSADREAILRELTNQVAEIPRFDLSKYALVDADPVVEASETQNLQDGNPQSEFESRPLILVISGLGGPTALRKLLQQVNAGFSKIIVISHEIDVMQLEKLRDQLQKISKIPMLLPLTDEFLKKGNIYILNKKQTIQSTSLGYQCIAGNGLSGYILQMDHDVDIVILSGADEQLSQPLIQVSSLLNNLHVQAPDECFEPALAQLLINTGAPLLDHDVVEHWFN
jgi:CheB methylesterase